MSKEQLNLSLLDNGLDFVLKGIEELFGEQGERIPIDKAVKLDTRSYKYGVTNLFSGFLLLLKERLSRHVPEMIFSGKLMDVKQKLASKKNIPNTVDLDEALERLEVGPKFVFEADDIKVIKRIQNFRNQFEHYEVRANKFQLLTELTKFLDIIEQFSHDELSIDLATYSKQSKDLHLRVNEIRDYVSASEFQSKLEERVVRVLQLLQGKTIAGRLLNSRGNIQLPEIIASQEEHVLPNGKRYRADLTGRSGNDIWNIEVKGYMRPDALVSVTTLYELFAIQDSKVSKLWLISFGGVSKAALKFALEHNIYVTDEDLWEEIEQI